MIPGADVTPGGTYATSVSVDEAGYAWFGVQFLYNDEDKNIVDRCLEVRRIDTGGRSELPAYDLTVSVPRCR
jgi:hypothetical protein